MIKPTVAEVKRLTRNGAMGSWAGFKHKLIEHGVIKDFYEDVPVAWCEAYCKACGRKFVPNPNLKDKK